MVKKSVAPSGPAPNSEQVDQLIGSFIPMKKKKREKLTDLVRVKGELVGND